MREREGESERYEGRSARTFELIGADESRLFSLKAGMVMDFRTATPRMAKPRS